MSYFLGISLLALAIIIALFGDRTVQERGGAIQRTFSLPKRRVAFVKWPIAVAVAFAGLWVLLGN
jgi:hypothetical protein